MEPVLSEVDKIYYVDSSHVIDFIKKNSEMEWNEVCEFVRYHNICGGDYGNAYWVKEDLVKCSKEYNENQVYWVGAFFEAHPWIERMMVVFDN